MNQSVILFGGSSGERLVSVASAQNLVENFDFDAILYLDKSGLVFKITKEELLSHANPFLNEFKPAAKSFANSLDETLSFLKSKTVFLALHGTEGEDGKIQSLFEKNKISFTASDSKASKNAFNKKISKSIVAEAGIATSAEFIFSNLDFANQLQELVTFFKTHSKIVLKPLANGSSLGLFIVETQPDLLSAIEKIRSNGLGDYIAEKFIVGRELTVGIYESQKGIIALPPSEVILNAGRSFDYEGKYLGKGTQEITPAQLNLQETQLVQKMALKAHSALHCFGYTRTDLILTANGPIYLETNTLPGLSRPSFIPQQLGAAKILFSDFIKQQLFLAEKRNS